MKHAATRRFLILSLALLATLSATARAADAGGLVGALVSQLGVTEAQAMGGAGLLLGGAQKQMAPGDWTQVAAAVPNLGSILGAAPDTAAAAPASGMGAMGGMLGQAATRMGGDLGTAALASGFSALGLDPSMAAQFVPVIVAFVQSEAGRQTAALLGTALGSML